MSSDQTLRADALAFWASRWTIKDQSLHIEAGDLDLSISRLTHEWLLNYHWQKRGNNGRLKACLAETTEPINGQLSRLAVSSDSCGLTLQAKLADRPVIVRPYSPLTIAAHHKITLYVSTPLWLTVCIADTQVELPLQQLSDTWMGALTGEGSLCYGSQTHARLDKSLLLKLPYRALTPVSIDNLSDENVTLERLSIPTPYLSLYEGENQLTTEPLSFIMDVKNQQGSVTIGEAVGRKCITPAREEANRGILTNTWENLFA